jgi:hypothetical protein
MEEAELEDLPEQNSRPGCSDFGRIGMQTTNAGQIIDRDAFDKLHRDHA